MFLEHYVGADNSVHVQVQSDNTTTVCYINNMGEPNKVVT